MHEIERTITSLSIEHYKASCCEILLIFYFIPICTLNFVCSNLCVVFKFNLRNFIYISVVLLLRGKIFFNRFQSFDYWRVETEREREWNGGRARKREQKCWKNSFLFLFHAIRNQLSLNQSSFHDSFFSHLSLFLFLESDFLKLSKATTIEQSKLTPETSDFIQFVKL